MRANDNVSIHAPVKGATPPRMARAARRWGFNPRPREGGDSAMRAGLPVESCFNPRPREGGDRPQ